MWSGLLMGSSGGGCSETVSMIGEAMVLLDIGVLDGIQADFDVRFTSG